MDWSFKEVLDELVARVSDGPMQFRFILQPLMSMTLGIRDGRVDARSGLPPFVWGLIARKQNRAANLRIAFWRLRVPVAIATTLDAIAQYIMFEHIRPLSAVFVGSLLMAGPYAIARGLSNRFRCKRAALRAKAAGGVHL